MKEPSKTLVDRLKKFIYESTIIVVENNDCGFFDGGCHTLAHTISSHFKRTKIYHISRTFNRRDHSVVYFEDFNKYFDADGFQTAEELFTKMRTVEMTKCNVLLEFNDFNKKDRVFIDTHEIIRELLKSTKLVTL
jgi:hypothetical protein